jgi:hypothetical protein
VLKSILGVNALPEYVRLAANYWSADELIRWAASLGGGHIHAPIAPIVEQRIIELEKFVPRYPPPVTLREPSARALSAIDLLGKLETQQGLQLTLTDQFDWLPTRGGLVRDLSYDLSAPLAFFQLNEQQLVDPERHLLQRIYYQSITLHDDIAKLSPRLTYHPSCAGWRQRRYQESATCWLQGISTQQLRERLDRLLIVQDLWGNRRLATKEEFKEEFDRIQSSRNEHERRSLGVLVNPLFGFTPTERPVYWRVLALQQRLYQTIVNETKQTIFSDTTRSAVEDLFVTLLHREATHVTESSYSGASRIFQSSP